MYDTFSRGVQRGLVFAKENVFGVFIFQFARVECVFINRFLHFLWYAKEWVFLPVAHGRSCCVGIVLAVVLRIGVRSKSCDAPVDCVRSNIFCVGGRVVVVS